MTSTVDIPAQHADTVDALAETDEITVSPAAEEAASGSGDAVGVPALLTAQEREAEYFTIQWLAPGALIIGPNVRVDNAKADKATGRDYKRRGVRTPVLAYRDELGRFVVIDGQRRVLNAVDAGVTEMMVLVQPPPIEDERQADIDRIVNQLGDNDMRVEITRNDRYQAHAQLRLYGLSATEIARQLSRPRKQIEQSLQVGDSELAAKAADKYSLTVDQAAAVAEFEGYGDIDAVKELITTAVEHPNNFNVLVRAKRAERTEDERLTAAAEKLTSELTATGVTILDESVAPGSGAVPLDWLRATPDTEPGTVLSVEDHASCPGRAAWVKTVYDDDDTAQIDAKYGCTDFRAHGHARIRAPHGTVESTSTAASGTGSSASSPATRSAVSKREELEREQSWIRNRLVRANNKLWDAAVEERRAWLAQFAQRKSAPRGAQAWLAGHKLDGEIELRRAMEQGHKLAHELLKLAPAGYGTRSELTERIANASAAKATVYDVFLTLTALEESLHRDAWRSPYKTEADYIRTITGWGYNAHDIELKVLDPGNMDDAVAAVLAERDDTGDTAAETDDAADDSDAEGEPTDPETGRAEAVSTVDDGRIGQPAEDPADAGSVSDLVALTV